MAAAFCVLIAPKGLEVGEDHELHRANQARELQQELAAVLVPVQDIAKSHGCTLKFKEGGVVAAVGDQSLATIATSDDRVVVFQGHLKNLTALARQYGSGTMPTPPPARSSGARSGRNSRSGSSSGNSSINGDLHSPRHHDAEHELTQGHQPDPSAAVPNGDAVQDDFTWMNPAEVILSMYEAMGMALLAHLQGKFSFCMYDSKQMRVLAARDGSGAVPLLQARTSRDGLVIASCAPMLACCHDTMEFQPGFFKYGWHAEPRLFTATDVAVAPALSAIRAARVSMDVPTPAGNSRGNSRRGSLDIHARGGHAHPHAPSPASHPRPVSGRRTSMDANGSSHGGSPAHNHGHTNGHSHPSSGIPPHGHGHREDHHHTPGSAGKPQSKLRSSWETGKGVPAPGGRRPNTDVGGQGVRSRGSSGNGAANGVWGGHASPRPQSGGSNGMGGGKAVAPAAVATACGNVVAGMSHLNVNAKAFMPST